MGADRAVLVTDDGRRRLRPRRDERVLAGGARARERRPRAVRPAGLATPTAPSSGPRSPSGCAARSSRRPPSSRVDGGSLRVKRQTEFGYDVIEAPLPAVVAVSDAINEPRYPSLKGIMGAKKKPFDTLSLARPRRRRRRRRRGRARRPWCSALGEPPSRGDARKIEDDGNAAQAIVDFLAEKRLV